MKLFLGEYSHTLDDRGRITLPRKIRQELDAKELVLSKGFDQCIFGYALERWEEDSGKQLAAPVTDSDARKLRRYMFAAAEKADIDKLGRVVLPAHLKEYGKIKGEVVIIGAGDHIEIWDKEAWNAYAASMETA